MAVISRSDIDFLLHDWLDAGRLAQLPRFAGQDREDWGRYLDLAHAMAEREFLPCWKTSDRQEPWMENGEVRVEPALAAAVRLWLEAGLHLADVAPEEGGMGLPFTVATAGMAGLMAANVAGSAFVMLSCANARLICAFGTPAQVAAFARPQHAGRALGTMCLSEPEAGSSLGDITTRARAAGRDDLGARYRISGAKMWISAGDQDITGQIVHLVLAKVVREDGTLPEGSRGISLFMVPKILPDGSRNDISVTGLNHKMGYRGTPNCAMAFGEREGATGWLVGQEGQGLAQMFQMMNEARINVGLSGAAMACRGHFLSTAYACERRQGRAQGRKGQGRPVPIVAHPDIRRMLLAQRAIAEGALALCLKSAMLADLSHAAQTQAERDSAAEMLALLTPVTKSWPSEQGLAALSMGIQIHGGYGYTRDFDLEQLYRDSRLNPIHEGTTGIQALDLLGRKVLGDGGAAFGRFLALVRREAKGEGFAEEAATLSRTADARWKSWSPGWPAGRRSARSAMPPGFWRRSGISCWAGSGFPWRGPRRAPAPPRWRRRRAGPAAISLPPKCRGSPP